MPSAAECATTLALCRAPNRGLLAQTPAAWRATEHTHRQDAQHVQKSGARSGSKCGNFKRPPWLWISSDLNKLGTE